LGSKTIAGINGFFVKMKMTQAYISVRWVGHVVCIGDSRGIYRVLVRQPEEEITWKTQK